MEDLKIKKILRSTLLLFINNIIPITIIVLAVSIPINFIKNYYFVEGFYEESFFKIVRRDGIVGTAFLSIITPTIIFLIHNKNLGLPVSIGTSFLVGLRNWPKIIIYGFVKHVIIFAGLVLFIIPGVVFYFRLLFLHIIITLEGTKGIDPIGKSNLHSKGFFKPILLSVLSLATIIGIPLLLIIIVIYFFDTGWIGDTIVDIVLDLVGTVFLILFLVLYQEIKEIRATSEQTYN